MFPARTPLSRTAQLVALAAALTGPTLAGPTDSEALDAPAAELFLAGTISTPEAIEHGAVVTPDGGEIWFTRALGVWGEPVRSEVILVARRTPDGAYGEPVPAPFSSEFDSDPFPSPDGEWIYFVSERPAPTKEGEGPDLWRVRRTADGWGTPEHLVEVSTPGYEASPVVTRDGDLWFASMRPGGVGSGDLWRARADGEGGFEEPENLGPTINSTAGEWNLWVSPDARWLIFEASGRPRNVTVSGDLYLSRRRDHTWSEPVHLAHLNTPGSDLLPRPGPDGQLLFASSLTVDGEQTDIYAVPLATLLVDPGRHGRNEPGGASEAASDPTPRVRSTRR